MSTGHVDILNAALALSEGERAAIAFELLHSLKPPMALSEDDPALFEELDRRMDAYERDSSTAQDWKDVSSGVKQMLRDRRSP
ncbi:MAG: hypothetical protein DCC67_13980 [Planctomycetota bacterium]|nr:MAG: hypothetical protein DCC67_13980 [Planctomycetota bacterium]